MINKKTRYFLALFVLSGFLFQSCATIGRGTYQKIPVTSNPSGAKVIVEEEEMGYTPLNLTLKRKKGHIIRIERQGYNPVVINTTRATSFSSVVMMSVIGNALLSIGTALLGLYISYSLRVEEAGEGYVMGGIGLIAGFIGPLVIDINSGANYNLSPQELNVILTKIEGQPQPTFIFITAENFLDIKWIRIKCDDSDREDENVNLDNSD